MLARTYKLTAIAAAAWFATAAHAAPLTNTQILNQFNEVVLGNATSTSDIDGRAWVGGSLTGGGYVGHSGQTPASSYAGVNVAGSASGTNFNGGHSALTGTLASTEAAATSTNFGQQLGALSTSLSKMASTGSTVTIDKNGLATFNAVVNKSGVAVFDLTSIDTTLFSTAKEFTFNLNGASTVIMNSNDTSASINANFLGGSAQTVGSKIIWNFYDATTLNIGAQFGGDVLATKATLTNSDNIEGGVFVDNLTQKAEIHLQPFSGSVPSMQK